MIRQRHRDVIGADRQRSRVARNKDPGQDSVSSIRSILARIEPPDRLPVNKGSRTGSAEAETEHRLQRHRSIRSGLMPIDTQRPADMRTRSFGTYRLTGLRPAYVQRVPSRRCPPEIMIKGHDPMNLGPA